MSLKDDLAAEVKAIFAEQWTKREGTVVPAPEDLKLSNDAVELDATVLYADLSDSTGLVDKEDPHFAAEIYKTYLHCAGKVIRANEGVITAYDGDRVMAVFVGKRKNTNAVTTGFKLNGARIDIINPAIKNQYPKRTFQIGHRIGIDTSKLFIARTGVRGANDLVWVGRAANYAAKLATINEANYMRITGAVHDNMRDSVKTYKGSAMWSEHTWEDMGNLRYFRSNWKFGVDYSPD